MKCLECGTRMKTRKESYRYYECGLKHVTLVGVEVTRCPRCGNYEISIPRIEELHRLLAKILIEKSTRFTGEEVRFLRKSRLTTSYPTERLKAIDLKRATATRIRVAARKEYWTVQAA